MSNMGMRGGEGNMGIEVDKSPRNTQGCSTFQGTTGHIRFVCLCIGL